jgi:hypothetical protein
MPAVWWWWCGGGGGGRRLRWWRVADGGCGGGVVVEVWWWWWFTFVDYVIAHIWEGAIVPGVRAGCEREHKGAVEHCVYSPGARKALVRLGGRRLRGGGSVGWDTRGAAYLLGSLGRDAYSKAKTGGRRLRHEDQAW